MPPRQHHRAELEGNGTQINRNVGAQIARYTVITEWREEAIESGILERARDDARRTITQLLRGLSANENQTVEIIFDETQQFPCTQAARHLPCRRSLSHTEYLTEGKAISKERRRWMPLLPLAAGMTGLKPQAVPAAEYRFGGNAVTRPIDL